MRFPLLILLASYSVVYTPKIHAQNVDTTGSVYGILAVSHLNFDEFADTLVGRLDGSYNFVPYAIRWGSDGEEGGDDSSRGDYQEDTLALDHIPDSLRVAETLFEYPEWENFTGTSSVYRLNEDTLDDVIVHMRGRVTDSSGIRDTLLTVAIFGQHGLDTLGELGLDSARTMQDSPFFAIQLRPGIEMTAPGHRDPTGAISYVVQPIRLNVTPQHRNPLGSVARQTWEKEITVRVFPNPTASAATLAVYELPSGYYDVEIIAVNGQRVLHQTLHLEAGTIVHRINLALIPSGYYFLRLSNYSGIAESYPLVIMR